VHLHRIDPARNMRRFYRLDMQPGLFGGFAVAKEWGRIGARGRAGDSHLTEALAVVAASSSVTEPACSPGPSQPGRAWLGG
jgi:predicted DNA-binding WGR domain protein